MATVGEAPGLFLRKATGLVKGWSRFDAFLYSFMSVNFVCLGLFFSLAVIGYVPAGQIIPAVLISGVFISFMVVTYASLISVMPRAGGDYVWQSRILGGGIAFVLAVTGWWFILWYWTPVYASILNVEVLQPLAAFLKWGGLLTFLGTSRGLFTICVVTALLAGFVCALGMETYAKIQRYCFYIGILGLAFIAIIMLFGSRSGFESAFNSQATSLFGAKPGAYDATIKFAGGASALPASISFSPFFGKTLLIIPFLCFWILWPNWGATLYGEVRGASDFKRVMGGMMYGLWVTIAIAVVFLLLASKFFGWNFFNAGNVNFINYFYGYTKSNGPIPVWTYPPLLVGMWFHSQFMGVLLTLIFGAWFLGWAGTLFLSSTRVIFAAAFDRVLPEKVADVSEKRHVPVWALILMLVPSIVVSWFYAYTSTMKTWIIDATLVIAVTFLGTAIAAAIMPWRKKELYRNSAIAKYKILGIPMITVTGVLTALFLAWNLYKWLWPPYNSSSGNLYAINVPSSLWFMGSMYILALVLYVVAKVVRRSQGIDLKAVYTEIPVE
ncbi:MAG TPA: APC family permease [Actinomycetota bacterium]|nr:APC family permease [Actinomycetota bacterium]